LAYFWTGVHMPLHHVDSAFFMGFNLAPSPSRSLLAHEICFLETGQREVSISREPNVEIKRYYNSLQFQLLWWKWKTFFLPTYIKRFVSYGNDNVSLLHCRYYYRKERGTRTRRLRNCMAVILNFFHFKFRKFSASGIYTALKGILLLSSKY
jgi:hypothetical protein